MAVAASSPASAATDLPASLEACLASAQQTSGMNAPPRPLTLPDSCPRLWVDLSRHPATDLLDQDLGEQTSLSQLEDLQSLINSYNTSSRSGARFDFDGLPALLEDTLVDPEKPGWWERFIEWLNEKLSNNSGGGDSWLAKFLERLSLSPSFIKWFERGTLILITLLVMLLVGNELRHSSITQWLRRKRVVAVEIADAPPSVAATAMPWEQIMALPPGRLPIELLKSVIHHLVEKGLLPENRSLTNRELLGRLRQSDQGRAEHFAAVVGGAESALYGDRSPEQAQLGGIIRAAEALRV